jgi:hypothetical protein
MASSTTATTPTTTISFYTTSSSSSNIGQISDTGRKIDIMAMSSATNEEYGTIEFKKNGSNNATNISQQTKICAAIIHLCSKIKINHSRR